MAVCAGLGATVLLACLTGSSVGVGSTHAEALTPPASVLCEVDNRFQDFAWFEDGFGAGVAANVASVESDKLDLNNSRSSSYWRADFDWKVLQRLSLHEQQLLPGSAVLFQQPGLLERNRWQIALFLTAFFLQTALIVALLFEDRARKIAQSQSFQLMTELARRDRIATAGAMSASIAHEIAQPLTAIVSYGAAGLRWLEHNTPDLAEAKKALQTVVKEAHRAGAVIESVRAMFRHDVAPPALVHVDDLIQGVIKLAAAEIKGKGISLFLELDAGPSVAVKGSQVQLQQVIQNVVRNAAEAMSSTASDDRLLRISSRASSDGNVTIQVEDSGPGIAPDNVGKIFDPFFTTKTHGMGLGLSICRSLVEAHGGTLKISNGSRSGAVVEIILPQCQDVAS